MMERENITRSSQIDFPILVNSILTHFSIQTSCKLTVKILIRLHMMWRLVGPALFSHAQHAYKPPTFVFAGPCLVMIYCVVALQALKDAVLITA